jgi:ACS family pantothenate transporter-like MFS transporter
MGLLPQPIASTYSLDPEAANSPNIAPQEKLYGKPIKGWKGYIWDTWELPKDQRWLMFKVDAFVLTFASVGLFFISFGTLFTNKMARKC